MPNLPLSEADRSIDELGAKVQSEADARLFFEAVIRKFQLEEKRLTGLTEFNSRVARAEHLALQNPERRIPQSRVAYAFNRLMDEWNAPGWTRVSPEEFEKARNVLSFLYYPKISERTQARALEPNCRPIEAVYLILLLQSRPGILKQIREQEASGAFSPSPGERKQLRQLSPAESDFRGKSEYLAARSKYFSETSKEELEGSFRELMESLLEER